MIDAPASPVSPDPRNEWIPSARVSLPADQVVHIWQHCASCRLPHGLEAARLTRSEWSKAASFHRDGDRVRYLWRRIMLREIVERYGGEHPAGLEFQIGEHGKPMLLEAPLSFNVASSDDWVFVALSTAMSVGVDLERIRADFDWVPVAEIAFNFAEIDWISGKDNPQNAFTEIWVRREALFKAWGKGLHDSMRQTSVVRDGCLLSTVQDPDGRDWWLSQLTAPPGYRAAVALSQPISRITAMTYAEEEAD